MGNTEALKIFFDKFTEDLKSEAQEKNQKIPVSSFRYEIDDVSGVMYAADYMQYILLGRGPGKAPPVDAMKAWVEKNPDSLERARQVFKYITADGLAYIIGQKIEREGTDVYSGKKPAIDFLGVMDKNIPPLLEQIAKNEAFSIATSLRSAIQ